jgi:hypothetical protein
MAHLEIHNNLRICWDKLALSTISDDFKGAVFQKNQNEGLGRTQYKFNFRVIFKTNALCVL